MLMPPGRAVRSKHAGSSSDFVSDIADRKTATFVKKVLCADKDAKTLEDTPLEHLLPPLTSSNELDLQLYAFIAIIIHENVDSWYSKITPDRDLIREIIQIIAHCTRQLEQRAKHLDLPQLLLSDLPALLQAHIKGWRNARIAAAEGGPTVSAELVYHALRPHPALSPGRDASSAQYDEATDAIYRQLLAEGLLAVLLPAEDLQNPCLFALVSDVLADLVLGSLITTRLSQATQLYDLATKITTLIQMKVASTGWLEEPEANVDRIDQSEAAEHSMDLRTPSTPQANTWQKLSSSAVVVISIFSLLLSTARHALSAIMSASSLPARESMRPLTASSPSLRSIEKNELLGQKSDSPETTSPSLADSNTALPHSLIQPIMSFQLWPLLEAWSRLDERLSWLCNYGSLFKRFALRGPGRLGCTNASLDRILASYLVTPLQDPGLLPTLLRTARATLFPNNETPQLPRGGFQPQPASSSGINDDRIAEVAKSKMKRKAAVAILNCVPRPVAKFYYGATTTSEKAEAHVKEENEDMIQAVEEDILTPFENAYANRHLVYAIIELIVGSLIDELRVGTTDAAGGSVAKLLEERGVETTLKT